MQLDRRALLLVSATAALPGAGWTRALPALDLGAAVGAGTATAVSTGRLPDFDVESRLDFLRQFRTFTRSDYMAQAGARAFEILKAHGIGEHDVVPLETVLPLLAPDPLIASRVRALVDEQHFAFKTLRDYFHRNADHYLAALAAADPAGPGTLELNPQLAVPDYCRLEFNGQPGGYGGDPFAGYLYHYYTLSLALGEDTEASDPQDRDRDAIARAVAVPAQGGVRRILDLGTGAGQLATALKRRFPDAEVWGIDAAAPMLRYAHLRANAMSVPVHFVQALAEDNGFPDGHFDLVVSHLLHHEVTAEASRRIFKETSRVLRPGGIYYPQDLYTTSPPRAPGAGFNGWLRFRLWVNYRWAYEPWLMQWYDLDFRSAMREVGFRVSDDGRNPSNMNGFNVVGVRV